MCYNPKMYFNHFTWNPIHVFFTILTVLVRIVSVSADLIEDTQGKNSLALSLSLWYPMNRELNLIISKLISCAMDMYVCTETEYYFYFMYYVSIAMAIFLFCYKRFCRGKYAEKNHASTNK